MRIADREIGPGQSVFVVAEIGAAHGGDLERALKLIYEARRAGADAVKFQCYEPEDLTIDSDAPGFVLTKGPWAGMKLWDLYERAQTPYEWFPKLFEYAKEVGIIAFSSVFSERGLAMLEGLGCPAYKIASAEITMEPLLMAIGATRKPVVLSIGMATATEETRAIGWLSCWTASGKIKWEPRYDSLAILNCVSAYPARIEDSNLDLLSFNDEAGVPGISDHSPGWQVPVMAVALGAQIIEKHLQLDTFDGNPDAGFALEPDEFKEMVQRVRMAEAAMREPEGDPEAASRQFRRRYINGKWIRCGPEAE